MMKSASQLPSLPLSYYSDLYTSNQLPSIGTSLKGKLELSTLSPYTTEYETFPKDLISSAKFLSMLYSHFAPKFAHKSKRNKDFSFFNMLNPFSCDSEESEDEEIDFGDYMDPTDFLRRRKYHKYIKKFKKKKLKKKKILFKILLAIVIFMALKALFEKLYYFFPTIFPTTARDEYAEDTIYDEGYHRDRASDWHKAQQLSEKHRAFFAPNYEETRIDVRIPLERKILTDS